MPAEEKFHSSAGCNNLKVRFGAVASRRGRERAGIFATVVFLHALVIFALLNATATHHAATLDDALKTFDVRAPKPRPVVAKRSEAAQGAAARPAKLAHATQVLARPVVRAVKPSIIVTAQVPSAGPDPAAGGADKDDGSGSGGVGTGTGAGIAGNGIGSGPAVRSRHIKGTIKPSDYPKAARRASAEGSSTVRFMVGVDGRVSGCEIQATSGNADLDRTTCDLVTRRFLYLPARDGEGRYVAEMRAWKQRWWLQRWGADTTEAGNDD